MTWGITEAKQPRPAQGPNIAPPSNWQGQGAQIQMEFQNTNILLQRERQVLGEEARLAEQAIPRMGEDRMRPIIDDFNRKATELGLPERVIPEGATPEEIMGYLGPNGDKVLLDAARSAAEADPEAWADIDLSQEAIEAEITKRRAEENRVNQELLALSPNPGFNSLVGGVAAALVDPVNIALMPFGGGAGSLWRIMMAEAGLGALSEAIQYPTRKKVADELGLEKPDLMESMTYGALGGAVFGGAIAGVPRVIRAVRYARELNKLAKTNGYDDIGAEGAVRAAEDAIDMDKNPLDAVAEALKATPERQFREPLLLTEAQRAADPLMLTEDQRVTAVTPEPTPLAPDPITTESLPPAEGFTPTTPGETAALAEAAIDKAAPFDTASFSPDPNNKKLPDTRGKGARFHGATSPISGLSEDFVGSEGNIYGNGFYTSDAVSITDGYSKAKKSKEGVVYRIDETGPVSALDMEQPIPDWFRSVFDQDDGSITSELILEAFAEKPANMREFYDAVREISPNYQLPRYEVQEIFDGFSDVIRKNGYNAIDHIGGLRTKKAPHSVRIYLDPASTIKLTEVDASAPIEIAAPNPPPQPKKVRGPKPVDLSTFIVREGGIWKGNDAGELADLEYKRPGFLRAKQFETSGAGDNGGGRLIEDMRQRAVDAGYLRSDETVSDFLEAIRNDATGTNKRYAQGEAPDTPEEYFSPDYMRDYDPVDEFLNGGPSPFGFYVPKDPLTEDVIWDFNIERDFDDYLEASWQSASFSRDEIAEMKHYMQTIGGEAEDLVMSVFNRRTRFAEMDPKEAWKYDTGQQYEPDLEASFRTVSEDAGLAGSGGGRVDGPNPDAEAAPGGGTGAGRDYGVEATPAGQQAFIPGSRESDVAARQAEIAKRDAEVKMLQSKQRRLNQVRVEDSVDGLFAQRTVDLFDDMMSPEAQAAMDVEVNAMRTDTSDLEVSTVADDGRSLGSLGDVLNEIDEMDDLVREFDLCRTGGGAE